MNNTKNYLVPPGLCDVATAAINADSANPQILNVLQFYPMIATLMHILPIVTLHFIMSYLIAPNIM